MKNKIEFSRNNEVETEQFMNNQKQYSKAKQSKKTFSKIIKDKVKADGNKSKHIDGKPIDDESELILISNRMAFFLKFVFLFLILISLLMLFKKQL